MKGSANARNGAVVMKHRNRTPAGPWGGVSIVRMATSRIHRTNGSGTEYQIRSELSCIPPSGWIDLFHSEMTTAGREAGIRILNPPAAASGRYLLTRCSCDDVAPLVSHLLKQAAAAADRSYLESDRDRVVPPDDEPDWHHDSQGRWI